jgi:putative transposase
MENFEACIPHLRFPLTHARPIRMTDLPERLFVEERRRIIPSIQRESRPEAEFAALIPAGEFEHRQITAMRKEFDQESEAQLDLKTQLSEGTAPVKTSSKLWT